MSTGLPRMDGGDCCQIPGKNTYITQRESHILLAEPWQGAEERPVNLIHIMTNIMPLIFYILLDP